MKIEFFRQCFEKQLSHFMKMYPVGAELFHADWRTDKMKLIFAFRNSVNAPKNCFSLNVIEDTQSEIVAT
jgi:hypothetical protein